MLEIYLAKIHSYFRYEREDSTEEEKLKSEIVRHYITDRQKNVDIGH